MHNIQTDRRGRPSQRQCRSCWNSIPREHGRTKLCLDCDPPKAPVACVICGVPAVARRGPKRTCASEECRRSHRLHRYRGYAARDKSARPLRECRRPGCDKTVPAFYSLLVKYCSNDCLDRRCERKCAGCGAIFAKPSPQKFCTQECLWDWRRTGLFPRPKGEKSYRARAERYGVKYEKVIRSKVFERDGWTCGICDEPVDRSVKYPDLMSVSLDHVIPLSAGGSHTYDNVQCSHWYCNVIKNDGTRKWAAKDSPLAPRT